MSHIHNYAEFYENLNEYERKFAPKQLFHEGDLSLLFENVKVSVVGSRKATEQGMKRANAVTKALVENKITVVSGLAEGIDTIAHKTAIKEGGKTIAVLGTSIDIAYPKSNTELLNTIKSNHLAISQFAIGRPSYKSNFPLRNRLMALISDATIIVEASENSGTTHQAWEALRLGRLLFIMENVALDSTLSWPKEMIKYGAQVLKRQNLSEVLCDIPNYTANATLAL